MKIQDSTKVRWDELSNARCPVCNAVLEWSKNECGYSSTHCDRKIELVCHQYRALMTRNNDVKPS